MHAARSQERIIFYFLIVVGLLLAFWLRVENLASFPPGLSNDEAVNAVDAFHLSQTGNSPLYEDPNRPEPLYRIVLAFDTLFFGTTVWAFRFTSVLIGLLTVAAAYWAARECFYDAHATIQRAAGLAAAAVLTVALGHITLSRAMYRAIPQPLFMLLFAGFLMRGLRTGKRSDFIIGAAALAAALYTYTAALVLPAALGFVGLSLILFRRRAWRKWLPNLILHGIVLVVLMAPVGLLFLRYPTAVIGRAGEVQETQIDLGQQLRALTDEFFRLGDVNPQYNVESAPLLPSDFKLLFVLGLLALVIRIRQPSSALIGSFLVLSAVPVIAANEIPHGLRIMGEFAAIPLIIGAAVASLVTVLHFLWRRPKLFASVAAVLVIVISLRDGLYAEQTYNGYWGKQYLWTIHGQELPHAEWFFRTDRRDLARWMLAQQEPLLVPLDELTGAAMRTWLMPAYPEVTTANDSLTLPEDTRLVVPWALESGDLRRDSRYYALLQNGRIVLLPLLSNETHTALLSGIDSAEAVTRPKGAIDLVARTKAIPSDFKLAYELPTVVGEPLLNFGDNELQLVSWRGPETLSGGAQAVTYTLDWVGLKRIGHEYSAFLQLQTQDFNRIAGDDVRILRWLYPTTIWRPGDVVPDGHRLQIPVDLQPGAYRLVVGMYPFLTPDERLPIFAPGGEPEGDAGTIGWIKVPQREMPAVGEGALAIDATLGDVIALRSAAVTRLDDGEIQVKLYWESLVERPAVDATIFVHIVDAADEIIAQQDVRPWGGQYPTFIWGKCEVVETDYTLDIGGAAPDDLRVTVGMYTFPGPDRLAVVQGGEAVPDKRIVLGNLSQLTGEK